MSGEGGEGQINNCVGRDVHQLHVVVFIRWHVLALAIHTYVFMHAAPSQQNDQRLVCCFL